MRGRRRQRGYWIFCHGRNISCNTDYRTKLCFTTQVTSVMKSTCFQIISVRFYLQCSAFCNPLFNFALLCFILFFFFSVAHAKTFNVTEQNTTCLLLSLDGTVDLTLHEKASVSLQYHCCIIILLFQVYLFFFYLAVDFV